MLLHNTSHNITSYVLTTLVLSYSMISCIAQYVFMEGGQIYI